MAKVRIFENPDGSVRITSPSPKRLAKLMTENGISEDSAYQLIIQKAVVDDPSLAGLPFVDADASEIPANRGERHKWRIKASKFEVDKTVPNKIDPNDALKQRIAQANTISELKAILNDMVK